ncbi:brachyurin-like [Macrobrachium nipponense]|uniref:brachyurin-like n=1 Tax=Macrobrachium nipponense TaxID=159736 RepID=UPI0030C813BF
MIRIIAGALLICSLARATQKPQGLLHVGGHGSHSNVIRGREVVPHSYPYVVYINAWGDCQGFLISDEWVVTIAQCIASADTATMTFGAHNINMDEPEQVKMTSTEFIVNEYFHPMSFGNDIALVKLPEKIQFTDAIQPAPLPTYDIKPGMTAVLTGWGQTSATDPTYSDVLREGDVTISDDNECDTYYGQRHPKTVCVMTNTGSTPFCFGDFGGGLHRDGSVHGIASFFSGAGCDSGGAEVYTRIYDFVDWIKEKTGV